MKFQFQPTAWSCLPTAFGIVLDRLADEVIHDIGHDGSEIIWPELDDPRCRRGFSLSEMVNYCLAQGVAPVIIDTEHIIHPEHGETYVEPNAAFEQHLLNYPGVILSNNHAVAWDNIEQKVYDPMAGIKDIDGYSIEFFVAIFSILSTGTGR